MADIDDNEVTYSLVHAWTESTEFHRSLGLFHQVTNMFPALKDDSSERDLLATLLTKAAHGNGILSLSVAFNIDGMAHIVRMAVSANICEVYLSRNYPGFRYLYFSELSTDPAEPVGKNVSDEFKV
ncbi:MAG: hypothetical protein NTW50_04540 [Candidatus Berkelbacteria bacterium]|nr:hypothetical protein [Candidatus Berkelbacteria bacterium]